jgi:hypothetical protein
MSPVIRSAGAVAAGLVAAVVVIAGMETLSSAVYPLPAGMDPYDREALAAHISQLPFGAFLFVLAAWGVGTSLGVWIATRLGPGRRAVHGYVVAGLVLAASVTNMIMLPHPLWFWAAAVVVIGVAGHSGARLAA